MWPRVVEIMLGCWLAMSPFIFQYPSSWTLYWANDFICASLVATFAFVSCVRRLDKTHLATLAVAGWLIGVACVAEPSPPPPHLQNYAVLGLLLGMVAILPTRSSDPPDPWLDYYARKGKTE